MANGTILDFNAIETKRKAGQLDASIMDVMKGLDAAGELDTIIDLKLPASDKEFKRILDAKSALEERAIAMETLGKSTADLDTGLFTIEGLMSSQGKRNRLEGQYSKYQRETAAETLKDLTEIGRFKRLKKLQQTIDAKIISARLAAKPAQVPTEKSARAAYANLDKLFL